MPTHQKAVFITGGAKRLGQAMALYLAKQGYDIALHYSSSKIAAVMTQQQILKQKVRCELFCADLADERQTLTLIPQVIKSFKPLNLLINSAAVFIPNQMGAQDLTLFRRHWDINFKAPYILSCEFNRLVQQGQIINLIDTHVVKNTSLHQDYLLSKKALADFTRMAAVSWGPKVRVNGIAPGMILPPVNNQHDSRQQRDQRIPLKRVGDPRAIIRTLQFLIDNDYLTGQILAVDGGEGLV